ncbi:2-hydroxycarboxylate transporter family protein [Nesterenkonia sp. NBAIMH1]|uniref:2-hydroxycarboxylate transporter family protein n=1 Tax=Nesterenkonia sp. NBAIMH1 TaxID=2600320 RepID=UPI00143E07F4|nr:2-hydroxycarboxylate transporter family protein [Nesterenkonia sp. NBAIMH1]
MSVESHDRATVPGNHTSDSPQGTSVDVNAAAAAASAEFDKPESWTRIMGLPLHWFGIFFVVIAACAMLGVLPNTMLAGFAVVILVGGLLNWIGGRVPVLRNYGLPTVLAILTPAVLLHFGLFPESFAENMEIFTDGSEIGFIDFYVASLIAGSILGMPRALLLKAGARIAVPLLGTIAVVFVLIGTLGAVLGFGMREAVLFVAAPVMGGGVGAGIVPMSGIYADQLGGDAGSFVAQLIPAVIIANILTIFCAGVFNGMTYKGQQFFLGFNGNGQIVRVEGSADQFKAKPKPTGGTFNVLAIGLTTAATLFLAGTLIAEFVPGLHAYAWTILLAATIKIFGLMPAAFEDAVSTWFGFVSGTLTPALLVGISITYFEFDELGALLSDWRYPVLVLAAVLTAVIVSGALGWLVKMYYAETSIAIGMGMTDMGGTGDVAVVSAANRLELMPFLQVSSRIGGAIVLLVVSLLLPVIG